MVSQTGSNFGVQGLYFKGFFTQQFFTWYVRPFEVSISKTKKKNSGAELFSLDFSKSFPFCFSFKMHVYLLINLTHRRMSHPMNRHFIPYPALLNMKTSSGQLKPLENPRTHLHWFWRIHKSAGMSGQCWLLNADFCRIAPHKKANRYDCDDSKNFELELSRLSSGRSIGKSDLN